MNTEAIQNSLKLKDITHKRFGLELYMTISFLPPNYVLPVANNNGGSYMKIQKGENRIRILSDSPVFGWEYWNVLDKPVRLKEKPSEVPDDIRINPKSGKVEPIKHFWGLLVWNYANSAIEILQITQVSIQNKILELCNDADYGHPKGYDIKINKTGEQLKTEYSVIPVPHKALTKEQERALAENTIDLEKLFFEPNSNTNTNTANKSPYPMLDNTEGMSAQEINELVKNPDMATYWAAKQLNIPIEEAKAKFNEMRNAAPKGEDGKPVSIKLDFIQRVINTVQQYQTIELSQEETPF